MKNRSFFVAGALLLASLFTTSCKELASNFDQPVKSYLTVAVADLTIPTGDTDTIKASSINSDKPITYKSSDESVAIVAGLCLNNVYVPNVRVRKSSCLNKIRVNSYLSLGFDSSTVRYIDHHKLGSHVRVVSPNSGYQ